MSTTTTTSPSLIRLGIIGLSATGSWASHAHLPYLLSPLGRRTYQITGICNSTLTSSQAAIRAHNLDPTTCHAYSSVTQLASSPTIDMIVVAVKAPLHLSLTLPILQYNASLPSPSSLAPSSPNLRKKIFVEYPLGSSLSESHELLSQAQKAGMGPKDLLVGLEEGFDACISKVRKLIVEDNRVGKLVHVSFDVAGYPLAGKVLAAREYALYSKNGAAWNAASHLLNAVCLATGRKLEECRAEEANVVPMVEIVDDGGDSYAKTTEGEVLRVVRKDISDHTVYRGRFEKVEGDGEGERAQLVGQQRCDAKWPGEPTVLLRILGEKGQIKVTVPQMLAAEFDDKTTVELFEYATGKVEVVEWKRGGKGGDEEVLEELPGPARSMGRTYEAFAKGEHVGFADWETGVRWHEFMNQVRGI